jgi:hypothetical protein
MLFAQGDQRNAAAIAGLSGFHIPEPEQWLTARRPATSKHAPIANHLREETRADVNQLDEIWTSKSEWPG